MNKPIHPLALFRLSVLGPLASRDKLERGELKKIITDVSRQTYHIPNSKRVHISSQVIEKWYYAWLRGGIEALEPKTRCDKHLTHLSDAVKSALLQAKRDNPTRSINTLIDLLERQGIVAKGKLSRATVHRFLKANQLSKRTIADAVTIERRSFVAAHAGDIWHGDVLHGPFIVTPQGKRKVYLVSLLDDASRLIAHSAFCLGETALDIEGVLKTAVLKRGLPKKLIIDNGAAYRTHSLQAICARLTIRLIHCRPYEPEGKGKLERYHRTFRELFLNEINLQAIQNLDDLNARLWAWVEHVYHQRLHSSLEGCTPLVRYQQDLIHVRPLGALAHSIDDIFYHRVKRYVRKDATLSWEGKLYEVPYEYVGQTVVLVIDPHIQKALYIESEPGVNLGPVTLLDAIANTQRRRQRPDVTPIPKTQSQPEVNAIEMAYRDYKQTYQLNLNDKEDK